MLVLKFLFWALLSAIGYTYAGYGVVITLLAKFRPQPVRADNKFRSVSLLIAAYNEESVIEAKIKNSLALNYPKEMLEIVVVCDGSTDGTESIAERYRSEGISIHHSPGRAGKLAALKRVLPFTSGDIVIFSDANAFYNPESIVQLVAPFADERVGCVTGEKRVKAANGKSSGEGLYWRYESYLKQKDSLVYSVVGAAGEIFAIRRDLVEWPPHNAIIEDFVMSMQVARQGFRIIYAPLAQATEQDLLNLGADFERRTRIASGGFQSIWWLRDLLNPRYGMLSFQYISHRAMRWAVAPLAMLTLIPLNLFLAKNSGFYRRVFGMQILFYFLAAAGIFVSSTGRKVSLLSVPGYFVLTNLTALVGLYRFFSGRHSVIWQKAAHSTPVGFE